MSLCCVRCRTTSPHDSIVLDAKDVDFDIGEDNFGHDEMEEDEEEEGEEVEVGKRIEVVEEDVHEIKSGGILGSKHNGRVRKRTTFLETLMSRSSTMSGNEATMTFPKTEAQTETFNSGAHLGGVTSIHAAAVMGDKSALSKLIMTASPCDLGAGDKFGRTPLMYCMLGDRIECAELLIKGGADVNKKDIGGRTSLHWAAHKGNLKCLKMLISKGASWREKDSEGQSVLHLATRHKSPKCLSFLLKLLEVSEVDDQDKNRRTPLHWAASYGNYDQVKMLIKQDSNIGIPDVEGRTPLHWAASSKDRQAGDCVKLILETTPSVIDWQDYHGWSALHLAVADGNEAVVQVLVSIENVNVSALDNMFRTPLHWAAVLGHSKISALLLQSGSDFSSADSNGATPLHYAAQNNFEETVDVFLHHKDMKDQTDIDGRSAFIWACSKGAVEVMSCFIRHRVDIQQTDKDGGTPLHASALAGHTSSVKLLLDHGAAIHQVDLVKHTPLFRACEMGHTEVTQALIDAGAKVDIVDQDGRSPLHWAALGGHAYICQVLIKYGVDPSVRDYSNRTPLQCAAYGGYVNCMSVLLENHADYNTQDNEGMTALHWACSKGHLDSVKLLIEYHAFPNHMEFTEDRYTSLDYALMGEHIDVAQFMIEQGGLSITGIQDIAALKIQSVFRGYRVRKTFLDRKILLMKHEQLRKDAAKKRAQEEQIKRREMTQESLESDLEGQGTASSSSSTFSGQNRKKKESIAGERAKLQNKQVAQAAAENKQRIEKHRTSDWAARVIQGAWRQWRSRAGLREEEALLKEKQWLLQFSALTIQLAWRRYYRRKLLRSMSNAKDHRRKILQSWDPEVVAAKQKTLISQIYTEEKKRPRLYAASTRTPYRPPWLKAVPSPAAMSYNFALHQYHPARRRFRSSWATESSDDLNKMKISDSFQPHHFSYNLYDS